MGALSLPLRRAGCNFVSTLLGRAMSTTVGSHCPNVTPRKEELVRRVLVHGRMRGNTLLLGRKRVDRGVMFMKGNVLHRFCCGGNGSIARRFSCRNYVVVYVRDALGRRPARLVVRTLRPDIMCLLPCGGLLALARVS